MRTFWAVVVVIVAVTALAFFPGVAASDTVRRLAERGPPTLIVGTLFALGSPPALLLAVVRGHPLRLSACRLGHGLKMIGASAVVLPAGLLLAPLAWQRLPGAWLDGVVDAVQED